MKLMLFPAKWLCKFYGLYEFYKLIYDRAFDQG